MDFYERYLTSETKTVYDDIYKLKESAFLSENLYIIEKVLEETFKRTAYNLEIIYAELQRINYRLKTEFQYNFQKPLVKPLSNTNELLRKLDEKVQPFGFIPLSLQKFYSIVGSCNFAWDYEVKEDFFWDCADPIQIVSLDDLLSFTTDEYWFEEMEEQLNEGWGVPHLDLAADYFHKDNISGGPAYSLEITKEPSIDALFLNEQHNTTFIDYLRICFESCGFSNISKDAVKDDYQSFFSRVKPQMLKI